MKPSPEKLPEYLTLAALLSVPLLISPAAVYLYSAKAPLLQILGIGILAAWLSGLNRKKTPFASSSDIPVLFFLIWTGLSVIWARNIYLAVEQFVFLSALVSIYYVVSKTEFPFKSAAAAVSAAGGIISVYGIFQFSGYDFLAEPHSQPVSTLGNVNFAGEFIAPAVILTAALLLHSSSRREKMLVGCVLILQCAYLLITRARGAWVGLFAGALVFFIISCRRKAFAGRIALYSIAALTAAALLLTAVAGTGALDPAVSDAYSIVNLRHPTIQVRFHLWNSMLDIIRDYPVLGTGAGNLQIVFPLYRSYDEILEEYRVSGEIKHVNRAHNDFLEIASDLGLIGFGLFAWLLGSAGIIIKRRRKNFDIFEAGAAGMLACILVSGMFGFPLRNASTALLFWVGLGIISRRGKTRKSDLPANLSFMKKGSLVLLFFVFLYSSSRLVSDIYVEKGRGKAEDSDWLSAKADFETSVRYYYPGIRAHTNLASAFLLLGDIENAYASLKDTLRLNPNHHWANYTLGRVYFELRQDEKAVYHLKRSARFNPLFYSHLGKLYVMLGDFEKAEHYIMKQLKLGFADAECYIHLGELFEAKGEPRRAVSAYRRALRKNPGMEGAAQRIRELEDGL